MKSIGWIIEYVLLIFSYKWTSVQTSSKEKMGCLRLFMIQPDGEFHSKYGFRLVNSEYIWGLTWVLMGLEREKLGLSNVKYLRLAMDPEFAVELSVTLW